MYLDSPATTRCSMIFFSNGFRNRRTVSHIYLVSFAFDIMAETKLTRHGPVAHMLQFLQGTCQIDLHRLHPPLQVGHMAPQYLS